MHHRTFRKNLRLPLSLCAATLLSTAPFPSRAQDANPTSVAPPKSAEVITQSGDIFFYKVTVVQRDIDCVNYLHRSGSTGIRFTGTNLLPNAEGKATVKSERGGITIDADFKGLTPANGFGPEFLTYVLWAISPDGRPQNLGEVLPAGTKNNIHVTTAFQTFGLIVTAEPYYSVSTPSDLIVMKNVTTDETAGVLEKVVAHATLLPHGLYDTETAGSQTVTHPITRDEHSPLELYEAYNAVRIAQVTGSDKYSPSIYANASSDLKSAADIDAGKHADRHLEISFARGAVEKAEDARVDTLRKQAAERQTERRNSQGERAAAGRAVTARRAAVGSSRPSRRSSLKSRPRLPRLRLTPSAPRL